MGEKTFTPIHLLAKKYMGQFGPRVYHEIMAQVVFPLRLPMVAERVLQGCQGYKSDGAGVSRGVGRTGHFEKWLAKLEWQRNNWLGVRYSCFPVDPPELRLLVPKRSLRSH
jgi:hypothetical protein